MNHGKIKPLENSHGHLRITKKVEELSTWAVLFEYSWISTRPILLQMKSELASFTLKYYVKEDRATVWFLAQFHYLIYLEIIFPNTNTISSKIRKNRCHQRSLGSDFKGCKCLVLERICYLCF